jgi:peroxiredoxin (alkyl hydroperoxide reductase subunit C)
VTAVALLRKFRKQGELVRPAELAETLRQIQAFQLVRENKGAEATPSGWKPGKMTLKPGPELVGRVWEVWKTHMESD